MSEFEKKIKELADMGHRGAISPDEHDRQFALLLKEEKAARESSGHFKRRQRHEVDASVCCDCGSSGPLVTTPGGSRVCRDCWMGENWED